MVALYFSVRSARMVMRTNAPRGARFTRVQNQKPFQFFASLPRPLPALKRRKGFLVLVRRFVSQKLRFKLHLLESFQLSFFRLHANPRRSVSRVCSSFLLREPTQLPTHSPLASLAWAASAVVWIALWLRLSLW